MAQVHTDSDHHVWDIFQDEQGYYAACKCGWEADDHHEDLDDAYADGHAHWHAVGGCAACEPAGGE